MTNGQQNVDGIIRAAIKRARGGDREGACEMLLEVAERDPSREDVWLWLAGFSDSLTDAQMYLETVLALNPEHAKAKAGLAMIEKRLAKQVSGETSAAPQADVSQADVPQADVSPGDAGVSGPAGGGGLSVEGAAEAPAGPEETAAADTAESETTCPKCGKAMDADAAFCPACGYMEGRPAVEEVQDLEPIPTPSTGGNVSDEISPSFTLSIDQAEAIDACLERMAYESEASCIILADVTGQLISERGKTVGVNTQVLSALAAGELSATQEMARMVGEQARFNLLLHEGENRSVYLSPVGHKMLLIIVFDQRTPIGLVRIILKNAVDELGPILEWPKTKDSEEDAEVRSTLDGDFAQQLEDEFDASMDFLIE
jgi:predicted regulator of Ras-like GTPase activity (Roadblock/LC7/MglB family)